MVSRRREFYLWDCCAIYMREPGKWVGLCEWRRDLEGANVEELLEASVQLDGSTDEAK